MDWKIVPLTVQGISFGIGIEAHLFTYAALTGVFLIVVYDMLRIFRRVCPHGVIWIAVEDFFLLAVFFNSNIWCSVKGK